MTTLGSTTRTDRVDGEEILDLNTFYCLPRNTPEVEASATRLQKAGYEVIREDARFVVYAPRDGCSITEKLEAELILKPIHVKADVKRDVREESIECGGHTSFRLISPLPLQSGQSVPQTLTMEGIFRTLKLKDTDNSEWARVEVTSMLWAISPDVAIDKNHSGYFVDLIEIHLTPTWEKPTASARHAPAAEYVDVEETKMVQHETNGTWSLSLAKAFGATIGGGKKKTTGSGQSTVKSPVKEHWAVVGNVGGSINTCYRWFLPYWESEEGASNGARPSENRPALAFPLVPKPTMLRKRASVDWVWPEACKQPPAWDLKVKARVNYMTQAPTKKWFFQKTKVSDITSSTNEVEKVDKIEFKVDYHPRFSSSVGLPYFIPVLVVLIALILLLLIRRFSNITVQAEHQRQLWKKT